MICCAVRANTLFHRSPHDIYASRHPCRPNEVKMSAVKLIRRDGNFLIIEGADKGNPPFQHYIVSLAAELSTSGKVPEPLPKSTFIIDFQRLIVQSFALLFLCT
ncbi:MAG: SAM-dependent methyltransferase [Chlorobium sp.]|nr:MAG: SAM-dependent methyltransferase [Chlorobium sp.]